MKIIERDENKQERTNVGFYEVPLCSRCANRAKHARTSELPLALPLSPSISSVCRFCSEHEPAQRENNGSFAPVMARSSLGLTMDGPLAFFKRCKFVFSLSLCVYTLFYLDPQDLSHLDENCRSLMWVKQNYCASPAFFFFFFFFFFVHFFYFPILDQ